MVGGGERSHLKQNNYQMECGMLKGREHTTERMRKWRTMNK